MRRVWLLVAALAAMWGSPAAAELPGAKLMRAPQVLPADAWTFYGNATLHTAGPTARTVAAPEIKALARSLGADRIGSGEGQMTAARFTQNVFDHVRQNIATEFRFGLGKGGLGALIDESGTPFDQAELMKQLLAEGGVAASYKAGDITLTAREFGLWTGLVKTLTESSQDFKVDPGAACQFLADGGIPAACTADAQGNLSSVTLAHVWLDVGGVVYDPGYKVHRLRAGIDLAAAMTCGSDAAPTCGADTRSAAITGSTPGSLAGAPTITGVKVSVLSGVLNTYWQKLQEAVEGGARDAPLEGVVGGKGLPLAVQPAYAAAPAPRRGPWSEVPDQYRTTLLVHYNTLDKLFYADELAGRRIMINAYADAFSALFRLDPEGGSFIPPADMPANTTTPLQLTVDPPYAASGGSYARSTNDFMGYAGTHMLMLSLGDATASRARYFAAREAAQPEDITMQRPGIAAGAAQFAAQESQALRLIGGVTKSAVTSHYVVGLGGGSYDLATYVSLNSQTSDAGRRAAGFRAVAVMGSLLEGSVVEQEQDSWPVFSVPAGFALANRNGATFVDIPPGLFNAVAPSLQMVPSTYQPNVSAGARLIAIKALAKNTTTLANGEYPYTGIGHAAFLPDNEGYWTGVTKGGTAPPDPADPWKAALDSIKQTPAALRSAFAPDLANGALNLDPAPDLVTGAGEFPFSLPLKRHYSSSGAFAEYQSDPGMNLLFYGGPDASSLDRLGGGWTHNFQITAKINNDGLLGLGAERGLDATAAIAGLVAITAQDSIPTFESRLTTIFIADWIGQRFIGNAVSINLAPSSVTFVRRWNGTSFNPPLGSAARLDQDGGRSDPIGLTRSEFPNVVQLTSAGFSYANVTLSYTGPQGDRIDFAPSRFATYFQTQAVAERTFAATGWSFPNGVRVDFAYDSVRLPYAGTSILKDGWQLRSVSNSLGRSLTFGVSNFKLTQVTDENQRAVTYALGCSPGKYLACESFSATTPENRTTRYEYVSPAYDPSLIGQSRPGYRMTRWFAPGATSSLLSFDYDELFRLRSVSDELGQTRFYPGGVTGGERRKRGEAIDALNHSTVAAFDERNRRTAATDGLGRTTLFDYDEAGRLVRTTYPERNAEVRTYDVRSNLIERCAIPKERDGLACNAGAGDIVVATPHPEPGVFRCSDPVTCNRPLGVIDPRGATTNYYWNSSGYVSSIVRPADPDGVRPQTDYGFTTYTANNATFTLLTTKTEKIAASDSTTTLYHYNPANKFTLDYGILDQGTGRLNLRTDFTFDSIGNLKVVNGPKAGDKDTTKYSWDGDRRLLLTAEADPDGPGGKPRPATRFDYRADGALKVVERGTSATGDDFTALERSTFDYDGLGNKLRQTVFKGVTSDPATITDMSYDPLGRQLCTAVRMVLSTAGAPGGACDARGAEPNADRIMRNTYDAAGQLKKVEKGVASATPITFMQMDYTDNGKQAWLADARGNRTSFNYDGFGRLRRQVFPNVALPETGSIGASNEADYEEYGYDKADNRTSLRRRDGRLITFRFDDLNRLWEKHLQGDAAHDVYYAYDLLGRTKSARFQNASGQGTVLVYDRAGRLQQDTTFGRTVTSYYDEAANRTIMALSDGFTIRYDFDDAARLQVIRESDATGTDVLATFTYDDLGRRKHIDRGNGGHADYRYDAAGRLGELEQAGRADQPVSLQTVTYNPASQVSTLTQANDNYVWRGRPSALPDRTYDGLNRDSILQAISGGGYDLNGNLKSDGVRNFSYDLENRLIRVTPAPNQTGPTIDIAYDPMGRLSGTTTGSGLFTGYQYEGDKLVGEYGLSGAPLRHYVHGPGVDEPLVWYEGAVRHWLHADRQGSIAAESNGAGQVTSFYTYGPWGEPSDWGPMRFRYTGQVSIPEAQLYHYKARVYDPLAGRFLQTDPIGYDAGDPNLYAYVGDDPVNRSDPTGMREQIGNDWLREWLTGDECREKDSCRGGTPQLDTKKPDMKGRIDGVDKVVSGAEGFFTQLGKSKAMREAAETAQKGGKFFGRLGKITSIVDAYNNFKDNVQKKGESVTKAATREAAKLAAGAWASGEGAATGAAMGLWCGPGAEVCSPVLAGAGAIAGPEVTNATIDGIEHMPQAAREGAAATRAAQKRWEDQKVSEAMERAIPQ